MSEVKIEHGIEMSFRYGTGSANRWPWRLMAVGDSFLMPDKLIKPAITQARLAGNKYGLKFACRTVEGGVRVWRTK